VDFARYVAQVKHVARLSLAQLVALAMAMETEGRRRGKCGVAKGRGGSGCKTPRLIYMTEGVWRKVWGKRRG